MIQRTLVILIVVLAAHATAVAQDRGNIGHERHLHRHNPPHAHAPSDPARFTTSRDSSVVLPLPSEEDSFFFVVFGDRTGGPDAGVSVLADAVRDTNLLEPDLVMTVGDLIQGYNQTPRWMEQMQEYKGIMNELLCPWFPVAGNHDIYWRGAQRPVGEHEANYEMNFGPLWYAFTHKNSGFIALFSDEGDPQTGEKNFSKPSANVMSETQLAWLRQTLEQYRGLDHVFVFLHHPRWIGGGYGDTWEPVHRALVEAGNVTAVFAGHIHHMRSDPRDGIEYITLATVGGGQSGRVPDVGYLHQFHIVTVRKAQVAMASVPVGEVMDVREITGEMVAEAERLADRRPAIDGGIEVGASGGGGGELRATVSNPTSRPIEVELAFASEDNWWTFLPDHAHQVIDPGAEAEFTFRADRLGGAINDRFRIPELIVSTDYLAPGRRYSIPAARTPVPVEADLSAPDTPDDERVLIVDGRSGVLTVPAERIALADGPMTLECWLRARRFGERTGLVAKTENSEYGFFVNRGRPSFSICLNGRYVEASGVDGMLETNRWHHIAGVYDGEEVRLYVDGKLIDTKPGAGPRTINPLPLIVGADVNGSGGPTSFFDGALDAVRLSSAARYAGDSFAPDRRHAPDADTRLLLNMDAPVGPWAFDESGNRAHAMFKGAAAIEPD